MKLMAIICEYNPFHNGHAYQLNQQKKALGCDGVICLMSGNFVQRGEPAICDKWARSEMALSGGADLVLELPTLYALQSAEGFAMGGVSLLTALGLSGYLCFGSESGDLLSLQKIAELGQTEEYGLRVKEMLKTGVSYPKACSLAMTEIFPDAEDILSCANDMLGVEYIRAISKTGSSLVPQTILRELGKHDSDVAEDGFLSATAIRSRILAGESVSDVMPQAATQIIEREMKAGRGPVTVENLDLLLCYALQQIEKQDLSNISGVSEGLENRLIEAAGKCRSFRAIAEEVKTKRYPYTRICRVLLHALLGITKEDENLSPGYARILGIGEKGPEILKHLQKTTSIPLINKTADADLTGDAKRLFDIDLRATDLYSLLYPQKNTGQNGMDFYRSPVIVSRPKQV